MAIGGCLRKRCCWCRRSLVGPASLIGLHAGDCFLSRILLPLLPSLLGSVLLRFGLADCTAMTSVKRQLLRDPHLPTCNIVCADVRSQLQSGIEVVNIRG